MPTAASPALWGAAPPPSAPALPHAALPTAAAPNRADQVPWPPIRSSGHSMRPDQPLAACSRPQMTDVDVLPSDTSWLFEPTTGVHQFGGGSGEDRYRERTRERTRYWLMPSIKEGRAKFAARIGTNPFADG